jgi:SH3-like domain-containing protein
MTFTPSVTPTPYKAYATGNVWTRGVPDRSKPYIEVLLKGTPVTVIASYGRWLEVEWTDGTGYHQGWVPFYWVTLVEPLDPALVTPTVIP